MNRKALPTTQDLTCKLKLLLTTEQAEAVRRTALAYRSALNHASAIAFANGKMSHGMRRQTLVYQELRERFGLPSQMACHAPRQVAAAYKTLWERAKANTAHTARGWTKRRYKGLDKAPQFTALTVTLNHRRDWALGKEHTVSVGTLEGRIRCRSPGGPIQPVAQAPVNTGNLIYPDRLRIAMALYHRECRDVVGGREVADRQTQPVAAARSCVR